MEGEDDTGSQFDQQQAQCKQAGSLFRVVFVVETEKEFDENAIIF